MSEMFKVVTKAAIYNEDRSKVIVISITFDEDYGLPGGHIEANESIEQCMNRELYEECGIVVDNLQKSSFFLHENGKVVLAFTGSLKDETLESKQDDIEGTPVWMTKAEFEAIEIDPGYREFVLANF